MVMATWNGSIEEWDELQAAVSRNGEHNNACGCGIRNAGSDRTGPLNGFHQCAMHEALESQAIRDRLLSRRRMRAELIKQEMREEVEDTA
jgi:hypothetical protein